ncbi:hypothetical protein MAF45_08835 [Mesosutterella sp. OilRF-GAM-744-9]|uniref:Permease n=1 Tax=Mesosutterella porci TaxID=2915351 RepID=A0ABS9MSE2_9BURK|nr:DUF6803 family protein [Mesosutterella sp. oilRF-744-WT-GAM-9]MCG5031546.1 hypothetical protein [Mesosutterella sp. oilRF-744-WT-GAM-9]
MSMTHYMELLMVNSPWNLILFMAIPVILAETIAITELINLFSPGRHPALVTLNRVCGVLAGLVFLAIGLYLIPSVVVPVTELRQWRTWVDVVSVFSYLLAGIPMILIALLHARVLLRSAAERARQGFHIGCVAAFLVLSHVAMIFGMVDPAIAGWQDPSAPMQMQHMHGSMNADDPMGGHKMGEVPAPQPMPMQGQMGQAGSGCPFHDGAASSPADPGAQGGPMNHEGMNMSHEGMNMGGAAKP